VISKEELEQVLKLKISLADGSHALCSPGMKYCHYAPKAPIYFVKSWFNEKICLTAVTTS
jgi:Threonylcarbamoyl-AMP synthase, C-terminal domain